MCRGACGATLANRDSETKQAPPMSWLSRTRLRAEACYSDAIESVTVETAESWAGPYASVACPHSSLCRLRHRLGAYQSAVANNMENRGVSQMVTTGDRVAVPMGQAASFVVHSSYCSGGSSEWYVLLQLIREVRAVLEGIR